LQGSGFFLTPAGGGGKLKILPLPPQGERERVLVGCVCKISLIYFCCSVYWCVVSSFFFVVVVRHDGVWVSNNDSSDQHRSPNLPFANDGALRLLRRCSGIKTLPWGV